MKHELTEIQKHRFDRLIKAVGGGVEYKDKPVFFDIAMWFKHYGRSIQCAYVGDDQVFAARDCGTVACIHGHAMIEFANELGRSPEVMPRTLPVANLLGVSHHEYSNLCMPPDTVQCKGVTRKHAVEAIKHLKYNGRMNYIVWESIVNG